MLPPRQDGYKTKQKVYFYTAKAHVLFVSFQTHTHTYRHTHTHTRARARTHTLTHAHSQRRTHVSTHIHARTLEDYDFYTTKALDLFVS